MNDRPAVVIDNGTGYTKMGFSGNVEPQFIVPTVIATKDQQIGNSSQHEGLDDLNFYIGNEATDHATTHQENYEYVISRR